MESVAFHVLDNLLDHKRTLFLHDFKRLRFLLLFHFSPFRVSRWHHYINARGGPPDADFRWLKKKRPHRIVSAGSWEDGVESSPGNMANRLERSQDASGAICVFSA